MKSNFFWIKVLDCVLIIGAILFYNQAAYYHDNAAAANKQLKAYAAQIQELQKNSQPAAGGAGGEAAAGKYKDGTYEGSAQGYGGSIDLKVTVEQDTITDIQVVSAAGETDSYYNSAVAVIDSILDSQSTDVDMVSGATYSSKGIRDAVAEALKKAEK